MPCLESTSAQFWRMMTLLRSLTQSYVCRSRELHQFRTTTSLKLEQVPLAMSNSTILCDISTGVVRPYVPPEFRRTVFNSLHCLSHPGILATQCLLTTRFVRPGINSDVRKWAHTCIRCQCAKVHHRTSIPLGTFATPLTRLNHVHEDIVGPLPPSNGCAYLLTCVDLFTRWPEAIPIIDYTAETVARTFLQKWVTRFGLLSTITTHHDCQFESHLWKDFIQLLGTNHIHNTAYHPCANGGMVECFNRQLKSTLKASRIGLTFYI